MTRVLMQGAPTKVIGLEPSTVCEEIQIVDGIVIEPSVCCHAEEDEQRQEEKMDAKEVKMEA